MKENELISIVIPIYNVKKFLPHCLHSVMTQSYSNIEIILVDDGSTDGSGRICDEYQKKDCRIKLIHQKNLGLSGARNTGIEVAGGSYITFIDSDDWVDEDYVLELYKSIKKTNADIAITSHKIHYPKRIIDLATKEYGIYTPQETLKRILYSDNIDLSAWAKLYKKNLFNNIRFPIGRLYEDSATTYKLIDASKIIAVNSVSTYNYRMNNNSISKCDFSPKKIDLIKSTQEMADYIIAKYPKLKFAAKRRLEYARLSTLAQLAKSSTVYPYYEKRLMKEIKENRLETLLNLKTPLRDKIGLASTLFGFQCFKKMWQGYEKITKKEMI